MHPAEKGRPDRRGPGGQFRLGDADQDGTTYHVWSRRNASRFPFHSSPYSLCARVFLFLSFFLLLFSHSRPISYRRVITRHEHAPCIHPSSSRPVSKIEKPAGQSGESRDSLSSAISRKPCCFFHRVTGYRIEDVARDAGDKRGIL